ncbi:MAG: FAD-binding oxidoreductase, partial [Gammaproteobacteria bacterium]|nr:FAD-binding oxidoreductase [Gammaproteobacteria bacterium]
MAATLGHRRELCFWGWGYADAGLTEAELGIVKRMARELRAGVAPGPAPSLAEFELRAPRIDAPAALQSILSRTPYDRITHGYGKS